MKKVKLVCPKCRGEVTISKSKLECRICRSNWLQNSNIPSFIEDEKYWGEIPQELMSIIIDESEREGWRETVRKYLYPRYPRIYHYVIDEPRADFRFLLPLSPESVVLDIGSGWGTLSLALARASGHVVSLESVYERIRFTEIRRDQERLANIQLVQSDFLNLPFPKSTFDFVIMNGVLEWFGILDTQNTPQVVQENVLKKIHKLLKKSGKIYVGIENRFGFRQILGARDHSGLRFTSLMPRRMADQYLGLRSRSRFYRVSERDRPSYRTYTYSLKGYTELFSNCGFNLLDVFYPFPGYNRPFYLVSQANKHAFDYFIENLFFPRTILGRSIKKVARLARGLNIQKFVASDFCLIAEKKET